jgi:hypothetical protein
MPKNINNPGDEEFAKMDDLLGGEGGDMSQFEDYKKLDVDQKVSKLETGSKKLILSLIDLYLDLEKITDSQHIDAIAQVEQSNLLVLLKQVKYSEHVLDNLMRQLDAGGHMDPAIYKTIREMQKSSIEITLEVSRYVRTLPEYFKWLSKDIKESTTLENIDAKRVENKSLPEGNTKSSGTTDLSQPVRGVRELLISMEDYKTSEEELEERIQNIEEVEPTPIDVDGFNDDEEDEWVDDEDDVEDPTKTNSDDE